MERHVLVVLPHPDDETLGCGGTIAMHAKAGSAVTYVCGTLGEMGRNMGKPPFATRESLPILREKELREACRILGADLRLLGLRDKTIEFVDPEALATRIRGIIEELNPSLVITYHPRYSVHPDHMALGAATVAAVASMPPEKRPPVHCRAFGTGVETLGPADITNDVSAVLDIKMDAIRAHASQTQGMLAEMEEKMAKDPELAKTMAKQRSVETYWIYKFN